MIRHKYGTSTVQYCASTVQYGTSTVQYGTSTVQYGASTVQYGASTVQYGTSTTASDIQPNINMSTLSHPCPLMLEHVNNVCTAPAPVSGTGVHLNSKQREQQALCTLSMKYIVTLSKLQAAN